MAVTKAKLVENLCDRLGLSKRKSKELVEHVFEEVSETLENGEPVKLSGFGKFVLRDKGSRPGRNPKTGEQVMIEPRRVVTFRAGEKLKRRVEQFDGSTQQQQEADDRQVQQEQKAGQD